MARSTAELWNSFHSHWMRPQDKSHDELLGMIAGMREDFLELYQRHTDLESEYDELKRQLDECEQEITALRMTDEELDRHERGLEEEIRRTE